MHMPSRSLEMNERNTTPKFGAKLYYQWSTFFPLSNDGEQLRFIKWLKVNRKIIAYGLGKNNGIDFNGIHIMTPRWSTSCQFFNQVHHGSCTAGSSHMIQPAHCTHSSLNEELIFYLITPPKSCDLWCLILFNKSCVLSASPIERFLRKILFSAQKKAKFRVTQICIEVSWWTK